MDVLVLKGKEYVKASVAAKRAGYTADYVGQLCRAGKVDAQLVGRSWYVHMDDLGIHRIESKRSSRLKAREQVRKAVEEQKKLKLNPDSRHFERHIQYENDDAELIPEVRNLSVESQETVKRGSKKVVRDDGPKYTIENKGEKVLMTGEINIVDATEEDTTDRQTVIMEPDFSRAHDVKTKKTKETEKKTDTKTKSKSDEGEKIHLTRIHGNTNKNKAFSGKTVTQQNNHAGSFVARLRKLDVDGISEKKREETVPKPTPEVPEMAAEKLLESGTTKKQRSGLGYLVPATLLVGLAGLSLAALLEAQITYLNKAAIDGSPQQETHYHFDIHPIILKITGRS